MDTPIIRQRHSKNRVVAARDVTKSATNRQITPTETDKSRPPVADDRVAETDEETTTNNNSDEEEASSIEEDAALSPKPAHAQQQQQQPIRDDDAAAAHSSPGFSWTLDIDPMAVLLFAVACATRLYRLAEPNHIVFDELHYGKYVSLYMRRTFFFDPNPPLGKQLIAGVAYLAGYSGNFTFSRIGGEYSAEVPTHALRMLPALCGSVLAPCVYKLLLEVRVQRWMAVVGGLLIILGEWMEWGFVGGFPQCHLSMLRQLKARPLRFGLPKYIHLSSIYILIDVMPMKVILILRFILCQYKSTQAPRNCPLVLNISM